MKNKVFADSPLPRGAQGPLTAIEALKTYARPATLTHINARLLMQQWLREKEYDPRDITFLARTGTFAHLFRSLVLRGGGRATGAETLYTYLARPHNGAFDVRQGLERYRGTGVQNQRIQTALKNGLIEKTDGDYYGQGMAASVANLPGPDLSPALLGTPIAIIGFGAAGVIVAHTLRRFGFANLNIFHNRSHPNGIWDYENVYQRSRNNPRRLRLFDFALNAAPGSGREVRDFLNNLRQAYAFRFTQRQVKAVDPALTGTEHRLFFDVGDPRDFPIVINCVGLGKPRALDDPARMRTRSSGGVRWQATLPNDSKGTFVFIGLGNSTAEMLTQLHALQDEGAPVDYRVLTHYPHDAVMNPDDYVATTRGTYRVFRDISQPNLVDYQGDLDRSRYDYYRALHTGRIISDVQRWERLGDVVLYWRKRRRSSVACTQHSALVGYAHTRDTLAALGITCGRTGADPQYDYDGEFHHPRGGRGARLARGYFGFGACLDAPWNPNTIVIPGMLGQLPDLMFGVIMRATAYQRAQGAL